TGLAENVGYGPSFDATTSAFYSSPTHRANILGNFTVVGVGVATGSDGTVWVTEEFARLKSAPAPAPAPRPAAPRVSRSAPRPAAPPAARIETPEDPAPATPQPVMGL